MDKAAFYGNCVMAKYVFELNLMYTILIINEPCKICLYISPYNHLKPITCNTSDYAHNTVLSYKVSV